MFRKYIATVKTLIISGKYIHMKNLSFFENTSPAPSAIVGTLGFHLVAAFPKVTLLGHIITKYCCSLMPNYRGGLLKSESPIFIKRTICKKAD